MKKWVSTWVLFVLTLGGAYGQFLGIEAELTMEQLGAKLGKSAKATISKWENGEHSPLPSIDEYIKLAELYNCNVNWLMGIEVQPVDFERKMNELKSIMASQKNSESTELVKRMAEMLNMMIK